MDQRRLTISDIAIGDPLPWNIYDDNNKLLLRRGQVVQNVNQIEALLQRGLFVEMAHVDNAAQAKRDAMAARKEAPSALRFINLVHKRLERLLYNLGNENDVESKIREVVKALGYACDINAEVVFASILLNQDTTKYAIRHCVDTALLAMLVSRAMNKSAADIERIAAAALTMNIGMLRQHDQLAAREDALTDKELELVKSHPHASVEALRQAGISDPDWLKWVELHHENEDGSGYPVGGNVGVIPQEAKILGFADRFCAAIVNRKYRKTLLPAAAMRDVLLPGGKPHDAMLAAYFIKELGNYPPGTFVRLQNGEIGVVTRRPLASGAHVVHAFIGPRGAPLSFPIQRDTGKELYAIREALAAQQVTLRFSMQQLWGDDAAL